MNLIRKLALALPLIAVVAIGSTQAKSIQVVVWDEQQPKQKSMYKNFLGNHIAGYLRELKGFSVRSIRMDDPQQGLSDVVLDNCDVLIWWGHLCQDEISVQTSRRIVERIKAGKLNFIVLHSAHWSTPFMVAMEERTRQDALARLSTEERAKAKVQWLGEFEREPPKADAPLTPSVSYERASDGSILVRIVRPNCCFPEYEAYGKPSKMKTLLPGHPIASDITKEFTIPQTEMYGEPFHVPTPDAVIFEELGRLDIDFEAGRSGTWVGGG